LTATRQLGVLSCIGLWAALCLGGALYASWLGYGGRSFAATLTVFAALLAVMLLFAAPGVADSLTTRFGAGSGFLLGAAAFLAYLIYALGTNTFVLSLVGGAAALIFAPLLLAASAKDKAPGAWQDYATLVGIWIAVKFYPSRLLWPYPEGRLGYVMTVLLAVNVALAAFLLLRRLPGIGYTIGWGRHWGFFVLGSYAVFALIAAVLGQGIGFIRFDPQWHEWKTISMTAAGILFFTAWPEEFLFRGLLQNMLTRSMKSDLAGWCAASVLFGFSHITNQHFPNWRYVILASIAGIFYGWTWRRSGSIFASALVHTLVNTTWHFLFHTI